jgi:hypothetical protein
MCGCAGTAYHLGRKMGIEMTVQYFIDEGVLEIEREDD